MVDFSPVTRYAQSGPLYIAYQVIGHGPPDLVFVAPMASHIELFWEEPLVARFLRRLATFSRLVLFDKRGTGLSDRVPIERLPTLDERMDDLRAVMDAAGSERAVLFGASEGGPLCMRFAATYPERTAALVLWSTYPRRLVSADFPEGSTREVLEANVAEIEREFATGDWDIPTDGLTEPERARFTAWWARHARSAVSPGGAVALARMAQDVDVRALLPTIAAPTIALSRARDGNAALTRYITDRIPGARYVELAGRAHNPFAGEQDIALAEIEQFVTGRRPTPTPERILLTVLFLDLVASTEHAIELGDRRWKDALDGYRALVRRRLDRELGQEVDTAGDGFFATFDRPARAVHCALAVIEGAPALGLAVRAGVHTGECEVVDGQVTGVAVHIGARVAALAGPGEVLVSGTVRDLVVGSDLAFDDRDEHELKGVPGRWHLWRARAR
ncbi:MAG TPA: adenylate/guanylate cyclase domain-containing protein [Candidatus Dormibacteraeota bacterium]|nr:adenylate/guanylate cyclase domain-containing protein [Candidatus Dormibacteraeota bacterium]